MIAAVCIAILIVAWEKNFTFPADVTDQSKFRLVELFLSYTDSEVKTQIIQSFPRSSPLLIVCSTVAFGMGLDCPDV